MSVVDGPSKLRSIICCSWKSVGKTQLALKNLMEEFQVWSKKTMMTSEPKSAHIEQRKDVLIAQMDTFLEEMKDAINQCFEDLGFLFSKKVQIKSLLEKLPTEMEANYSRQFDYVQLRSFILLDQ